jgi:transcriptional regulator GlxA family with amidase domain
MRWRLAHAHLLRAKDEIDRRYAEPLDVATLARAALASEAHFARSFKQAFGETPGRYLQRRRIERAADLLRETDLPVVEIGLDVGFTSIGSFGTAFRALMGEPPTVYRDRHRGAPPPQVPACFTLMWTRPVDRAVSKKPPGGERVSVEPVNDQEARPP